MYFVLYYLFDVLGWLLSVKIYQVLIFRHSQNHMKNGMKCKAKDQMNNNLGHKFKKKKVKYEYIYKYDRKMSDFLHLLIELFH